MFQLFRKKDTGSKADAVRPTTPSDNATPDGTSSASSASEAARQAQAQLAALVDLVEQDLKRAGARAAATGEEARRTVEESRAIVAGIHTLTDSLAVDTGRAEDTSAVIASSIRELAERNMDISRRTRQSSDMLIQAQDQAGSAGREMANLSAAIADIEKVVSLIAEIAGQTNLLALNATIEAARAGEAGRGFAVVAGEVKALSVETRKATDQIAQTISQLRASADRAVGTVAEVVTVINEISPVVMAVTGAVDGQTEAVQGIDRAAGDSAVFAKSVAERARSIGASASTAVSASEKADLATASMGQAMQDVTRQMVSVLRQTEAGDRRKSDRWPVELSGRLIASGKTWSIATIDLSDGGVLVRAADGRGDLPGSGPVDLEFADIGALSGRIVAASPLGRHIAFGNLRPEARERLARRIAQIADSVSTEIRRAQVGATRVGKALEEGLAQGRIQPADLFDHDYRPIPGTNPQQVTTRALNFLETVLPPIQEALLSEDASATFCACVDLNGYLPVHNRKFSQPQRPDDPIWNAANARNKRIFDDRTGLIAARNTRPFLVQNYARDLGGGKVVMMREVDAPILVNGRHWGAVRTARAL